MKISLITVLLFFSFTVLAQETPQLVKYDKNFVFRDGIYFTFEEFQKNRPSVTDFKVIRNSAFSGQVSLEYTCMDEITGSKKTCTVRQCWGYALNNNVYIAQGIGGYFFRLHIIGALIHYFSIEQYPIQYYDYYYGYPSYRTARATENKEYIIEFATGRKFEFTYKEFSKFLLQNDPELYQELQTTKKKKKMIYHFLLRYNEKHPIYFQM